MKKLATTAAAMMLTHGAWAGDLVKPNAAKPDHTVKSTIETVVRGYIATDTPVVLKIKSGDIVRIDTISHGGITEDPVATFGAAGIPKNQVLPDVIDVARVTKERGWSGHVLTGPLYVEGAEPGDMLEVRTLKIDIRVPYGVNSTGPTQGVVPGLVKQPTSKIIKFDLARNVALFSDEIEVPLGPFMGIMAVAPPPDLKRVPSRPPGVFGGNMDVKRFTEGSTVYLPVFNPGALFVTGDAHAAQGDGEVDGTAIEASLTPTMQFVLHKGAGASMKWPRGEDAQFYYTMGMDVDLDTAMKEAVIETVKFLEARGLSTADAYALASIGIDFIVGEAVDGVLLIYAAIPKSLFKTKTPYWTASK